MGGQHGWMMRGFMLAVFILTAGAAWFEAADNNGGAFSLAILRRDGVMLPFAAFDGKRWENPWPVAGQKAEVPILLPDTPKSWWRDKRPVLDWTLFPIFRDVTARAAHVEGINWFRSGCQQAVGLFTNYKPAVLPPPPRVHPYPKDALAVAGDVKIAPIEFLDPAGDYAKTLASRLPEEITPKEDQMVQQYTSVRWRHSYTEKERANVKPTVEALYRIPHGMASRDLFYYEAVKRYFLPRDTPPEKGGKCDLVTFASGWFTGDGNGAIDELGARVLVTSCDYRHVNFLLPLGIVTTNGKTQAIVQWSNATFESYAVMEARPGRQQPIELFALIETPGGACPVDGESDEEKN